MVDDNDNDNDTHLPGIIVRVGMIFRRRQKLSQEVTYQCNDLLRWLMNIKLQLKQDQIFKNVDKYTCEGACTRAMLKTDANHVTRSL